MHHTLYSDDVSAIVAGFRQYFHGRYVYVLILFGEALTWLPYVFDSRGCCSAGHTRRTHLTERAGDEEIRHTLKQAVSTSGQNLFTDIRCLVQIVDDDFELADSLKINTTGGMLAIPVVND